MRRRSLIYLFLLLRACYLCQSPDDIFDISGPDKQYLEHLIKIKVDSVRHAKGLPELINDSILYLASDHHSAYLARIRGLSHYETAAKYKNPQKRAEAFGGLDYLTGENVAFITAYKKRFPRKPELNEYFTYGEIATRLVRAWVKSRGHYRNMIRKQYQVTGVSIRVDKRSQKIFATQKFAEVKSKFFFKENTTMFPYTDYNEAAYELRQLGQVSRREHKGPHKWRLKQRKKFRRCKECDVVLFERDQFRFYIDSARSVHVVTESGPIFKQLTRRRRDGLALEIVHYRDYECSRTNFFLTPSRRNGQCVANGNIQRPVYKWKLRIQYRRDRRVWRRKKWNNIASTILGLQFKDYPKALAAVWKRFNGTPSDNVIGQLPRNDTDYFEANVLFLKKRRVCNVLHFTDYCGEYFSGFKPTTPVPELSERPYRYPEDTVQFTFTTPFSQGKHKYTYADIEPLLDTLSAKRYAIVKLQISAFASVEGDPEVNKNLTVKRAEAIRSVLDSAGLDSAQRIIIANEDWQHFMANIGKTKHAYLKNLKRAEIKRWLQEPQVAADLESILAEERRAVVKLWLQRKVHDSIRVKMALRRYAALTDSLASGKKSVAPEQLLAIQTLLYQRFRERKLAASDLSSVVPPSSLPYLGVYQNYLMLRALADSSGGSQWRDELYTALLEPVAANRASPVQQYNFLTLLLNRWHDNGWTEQHPELQPAKLFGKLARAAQGKTTKDSVDQLRLNFYFLAAEWFHSADPNNALQLKAMNNILGYYRGRTFNAGQAYRLARYFIYYGRDAHAYRILAPFALRTNPDPGVFGLYLKMAYVRDIYRHEKRFFRLMKTAPSVLGKDAYCELFTGPCNIGFQIFDHEEVRQTWCSTCEGHLNFAERYRQSRSESRTD